MKNVIPLLTMKNDEECEDVVSIAIFDKIIPFKVCPFHIRNLLLIAQNQIKLRNRIYVNKSTWLIMKSVVPLLTMAEVKTIKNVKT